MQSIAYQEGVIELFNGDEVVNFTAGSIPGNTKLIKADDVIAITKEHLKRHMNWNVEGVECEILSPKGGGWQKGKIKAQITLEFIPDTNEPENTEETQQND